MNHSLAGVTMLGTWLLGTGGWDGDMHLLFSRWVSMGWDELVASLCPILAGNAEPLWHVCAPRLGYDGFPPPIEIRKGQVFGWPHSKCLSTSSTGPVQPEGPVVKVVAPLPECQLRAELLKGEEHMGGGGNSTPLGSPAGRDLTKRSSSPGGRWSWLR